MSNMALLMTLRRLGRDDITAHEFRSTFSVIGLPRRESQRTFPKPPWRMPSKTKPKPHTSVVTSWTGDGG